MQDYRLREAIPADIDWIIALERREAFAPFIFKNTHDEHSQALKSQDTCYLIYEDIPGRRIGFCILKGGNDGGTFELKRIAVSHPGKGIGKAFLQDIVSFVFNHLSAVRIWLDVFENNTRAVSLYSKAGFTEVAPDRSPRSTASALDGEEKLRVMELLRPA